MYLITVFGNLLIILLTISDSHLHTPMYFFLSVLSFIDICYTSTSIPKMLVNIQTQSKVITYAGCITQMFFTVCFSGLDDFLLTVMAYDRFVAICHPLHYVVIMNPRLCGQLILVSGLSVVSLFYCTIIGVYLSSAAHSSHSSAAASVMYTVVTPMLNPFIYSLRNKDIKRALKDTLEGKLWKRGNNLTVRVSNTNEENTNQQHRCEIHHHIIKKCQNQADHLYKLAEKVKDFWECTEGQLQHLSFITGNVEHSGFKTPEPAVHRARGS
ncbi:olfactory receptor 7A17-like [Tupaia chinensis]|uniref:olfactory receptor 7A17-like n=1 Tax=Tupaia chinensis TaxID=246437 RepID=UPI000FFB3355|nr:olfactory receptor 7A17-like [Tupaia chinensis]